MASIIIISLAQILTSTEAVFMEQQEQLRDKIFFLFCVMMLFGCGQTSSIKNEQYLLLNKDSISVKITKGLLYANGNLFTGEMFVLYPESADTASIESFKEGKEHGEWRQYYPFHQLKEKRFFVDGEKSGTYKAWWPNGKLQLEYFFVDGNYEGNCREWNESGLLIQSMNYAKGQECGQQQVWYDNGKVKANYLMKGGRRYGLLGTKNCVNVSEKIFAK